MGPAAWHQALGPGDRSGFRHDEFANRIGQGEPGPARPFVVGSELMLYDIDMLSYEVKLSSNGQVSIPATVRRRWRASRMLVMDKGDRVIIRPVPDDPWGAVVGKYATVAMSSDQMRRQAREEDAEAEDRRG